MFMFVFDMFADQLVYSQNRLVAKSQNKSPAGKQ